jgi:hypothetical protein
MRYNWIEFIFFYLSNTVNAFTKQLREKGDGDLRSQSRRRRLIIPAAESAGYLVFQQEAIPFAEPSNDSSKCVFFFVVPDTQTIVSPVVAPLHRY